MVPTFAERDNITPLVGRLDAALQGISWEIVFVDDDSPDGTAAALRALALNDRRVRLIQRVGRRGLASACVEGILSSSAPYAAVMDADLQHDETILPQMLRRLKAEDLDLVVGSRYTAGGSTSAWDQRRLLISRIGVRAVQLLFSVAELKDPMSGFFMIRREAFDGIVHQLSQFGFKILLDFSSLVAATSEVRRNSISVRSALLWHEQVR